MKIRAGVQKAISRLVRGERGFTLLELIVAVAILGVIGVAFLSALTTGYFALVLADENTVAESLTRTEFEKIREDTFDPARVGYTAEEPKNIGYLVVVTVSNVGEAPYTQQVWTVAVYHSPDDVPDAEELILTSQTWKTKYNKTLTS